MVDVANIANEPRVEQVLDLVAQISAQGMRVCLPGRIEAYNATTHFATVQPLLMRRSLGAQFPERLPPIQRVPVVQPRTAKAAVLMPVTLGDLCVLVFGDRAMGRWKAGVGIEVEPEDLRTHDLSDAYAILGGYPELFPDANLTGNTYGTDAMLVKVLPGTKIALGNGLGTPGTEVLETIDSIITQINAIIDADTILDTALAADSALDGATKTAAGTHATTLAAIKTILTTLQTGFAALKV